MPIYNAPIRDMKFVLQEVLNVEQLTEYEKFAEADMDTLDAILEQSAKFSSEVLAPLNVVGDQEGCTRNDDGSVTTKRQNMAEWACRLSGAQRQAKCNLLRIWPLRCIPA